MSRLERLYSPPEIGAPGKREGRSRRRDLWLAGLFVLAMAAVALAALALVIPGIFGRQYRLEAYFLDARGLDPGIQVLQEGYVIGLVEGVSPIFPGRDPDASLCPKPAPEDSGRSPALPCFRATLRIRNNWPVPVDSQAQLGSSGLLSGDAIKVQPGSSQALLQDGAVIDALGRERDLMAQLSALTESLDGLVKETIKPALASIKAQIQTIETLLGTGGEQDENRERLAGAFENLRGLSAKLEELVKPDQIKAILGSVERMSADLTQVTSRLTGSTEEVQKTVKNYGDLAKDIRGLVVDNKPAVQRSLDDTQFLLQELSAALTPILTNIEDATRNLSALARDLRRDPAVIIKGREVEEQTPWFQ
jgi:phospholipid/cholesterol/gamma-HCH transport system substrate-binding protein